MSLLEIRDLNAGYGRVQVLWDVDFAVEKDQIVALVGANGAGKTTLLRVISGMVPSWSGTIALEGREIAGCSIESIVDLGGIASARGTEHYFLMFAALMQSLRTPAFNIRLIT